MTEFADRLMSIGIDPGVSGAIAIISKGYTQVYDFKEYERSYLTHTPWFKLHFVYVVIEKQWSMSFKTVKGQKEQRGATSNGILMENYGIWQGWLKSHGCSYTPVAAKTWQKEIFGGVKGDDRKQMSLDMARELFPELADKLKYKKDHNRADALLIAEYCRGKGRYA